MTTPTQDPLPGTVDAERQAYEAIVALQLERLKVWSKLPDERTDWALEQLLSELGAAATALRRLRNEAALPF